jgi:hypothetical protein
VAISDDLTGHFTPAAQITQQRLRALTAMSILAGQLCPVGAGKQAPHPASGVVADPAGQAGPVLFCGAGRFRSVSASFQPGMRCSPEQPMVRSYEALSPDISGGLNCFAFTQNAAESGVAADGTADSRRRVAGGVRQPGCRYRERHERHALRAFAGQLRHNADQPVFGHGPGRLPNQDHRLVPGYDGGQRTGSGLPSPWVPARNLSPGANERDRAGQAGKLPITSS